MKKYLLTLIIICGFFGLAVSQDVEVEIDAEAEDSAGEYAPAAGDISGALLFGRGNFLTEGLVVPPAPGDDNGWAVPGTAPYNNTVGTSNNDITNIVGVELRYFVSDMIAIKLSGGSIFRHTPSQVNYPGYTDAPLNAGWIPAYEAVKADERIDANVNLGAEYHFGSKYSKLFPYLGVSVPFYYSRWSEYDPTIDDSDPENIVIVDLGTRHVEMIGFGGQFVGGVDYYLSEGFYFGIETRPISYVYAYSVKYPAPGLPEWEADNHTFSFFSQNFLKVGFRF